MPRLRSPSLPRQWPDHVKSAVLHAIGLASVVVSYARGRAKHRRSLRVRLEQAETEIALLREELAIKDGRWEQAKTRRRPHYTPFLRMRILQLRAARGWTLQKTARVFLVDLQTLMIWMRRLEEQGERTLIRTVEPVNHYPDLVRHLVRELKHLLPTMGSERIANVLARAGLHLGATTVRRMVREASPSPDDESEATVRQRRRVVAKYPGHTWHVDLTAVPTRAEFWVSWFPFSLPQRWPFCWWVAVAIDQMSRVAVGTAVFAKAPTSPQVQRFLDRAIRGTRSAPRFVVTDKGKQFWCRSFKRWCKRREIRPRYGAIGQPASIVVVERFIRSMKQEATRQVLIPMSLAAMRSKVALYADWYNRYRPHMALAGKTPNGVFHCRRRAAQRFEPRPNWPHRRRRCRAGGDRLRLVVSYMEGQRHLPVIELKRAA